MNAPAAGAAGPPLFYGPWRVAGELGRGGMSRVLLVERSSPPQQAALKVLPPELCDEDGRRRFRREQEILARLEHPNIARFLDAGESAGGELYLVVEKVDGVPLDVHCRDLPLRRRLEILLELSRAVAAAHQQLIVHCDLKPSNVLVRADGVVKLLDFGLARPADAGLPAATALALFSTWAYASPEQLSGQPLSAASDVYSLGVLLYELATGRKLFGELGRSLLAQLEARRLPPRARLAAAGRGLPGGAPRRLGQDLDAVIAKALRPEPAARYPSVAELVADLEALLAGAPVAARRGERRYELRHFLRRNALPLASAALLLLAALAATVGLGLQARRLAAERDLARGHQEVAQRTADFLLELIEPARPGEKPETIQSLAARAQQGVDRSRQEPPMVRARVLALLGNYNLNLGYTGAADRFLREALEIWETRLDPGDKRVLRALYSRGIGSIVHRDFAAAESLGHEIVARAGRRGDGGGRALGLDILSIAALWQGEIAKAEGLSAEAEPLSLAVHHFGSEEHELVLMNLVRAKQARYRRAAGAERAELAGELEGLLRRVLRERARRRPRGQDYFTQNRATQLADILVERGKLDEAEAELRGVLALRRQRGGKQGYLWVENQHPGEIELLLADLRRRRGDPEEAWRLAVAAGEALRRDLPPDDSRHLDAARTEALALLEAGRTREAAVRLEKLVATLEQYPHDSNPNLAELQQALALARDRLRSFR